MTIHMENLHDKDGPNFLFFIILVRITKIEIISRATEKKLCIAVLVCQVGLFMFLFTKGQSLLWEQQL